MGKTISQLYSSDPAGPIADADLFELEQSSNSKGGAFSQIWTWILTKLNIDTLTNQIIINPLNAKISTNTTYTLTAQSSINYIHISSTYLVAASTSAQSLILSSGIASSSTVTISISGSSSTILHDLNFPIYRDLVGNITADIITKEESYTPIFTGFGTASSIFFTWVRFGNELFIKGRFALGTPTATEARISLPNSLITDSTLISTLQLCGTYNSNGGGAFENPVLIEPSVSYLTFGTHNGGAAGLAKCNGNNTGFTGTLSIDCRVPISGWN